MPFDLYYGKYPEELKKKYKSTYGYVLQISYLDKPGGMSVWATEESILKLASDIHNLRKKVKKNDRDTV